MNENKINMTSDDGQLRSTLNNIKDSEIDQAV